MRPSPPDTATIQDGDAPGVVTVEAPTAEAAIAAIHDRLGASAEIVEAEKVLRGGMWGFFPKQMVQLTARTTGHTGEDPGRAGPMTVGQRLAASRDVTTRDERPVPRSARPTGPAGSPATPPQDLGSVLERLQAEEDAAEQGLGAALRRHLGVTITEDASAAVTAWEPAAVDAPTAVATLPEADTSEPTPPTPASPTQPTDPLPLDDVEYARADGTPWSGRGLLTLGLPRGFVDAVLAQQPTDDAAWTYAVARALAPLCRPLPNGAAVLVGPKAEKLSRALGVPLVRLAGAPRGTASFAVACTDSSRARAWLAQHRGARWTHVVAGGSDWRGLLFDGPLAVSWVGDDMLGEAIRVAHDLGMVLGPGVRGDAAGTLVEPTPIELAMMLRDMLGGRR